MKSIKIISPGRDKILGPIELIHSPIPRNLNNHDCLVQVERCGICFRDTIDRLGGFKGVNQYPVTMGHEFSGTVIAIGSEVGHFAVGDRVVNLHTSNCGECVRCAEGNHPRCENSSCWFGTITDGGYSTHVLCPEQALVKLPPSLSVDSFRKSCFITCTAAVAMRGLLRGGMKPGKSVLVTGSNGGLHAIQVAKLMGASKVIAVTRRREVRDELIHLGATEVVVFHKSFHKLISGPVDVVLELVGSPTLNSSLRSLDTLGRCVLIGNVTVSQANISPGLFILKESSLLGSAGASPSDVRQCISWLENGQLEAQVAGEIPLTLEAINQAHEKLRTSKVKGGRLIINPFHSSNL